MSETCGTRRKPVRIGLLGASFDTGNMGVGALAESTIKCIIHRWPDAEVTLLDSGSAVGEHRLKVGDRTLRIRKLPIRFCRNIFLENHFLALCFYGFLFKVFRWEKFKQFCSRRNASLRCVIQSDMVADITGGDSFSDIYGMRRFIIGFLRKWLVLLFNKELVMLPQTYGPFKRPLTRAMARYILKRAELIYSRDRAGVEYVNALLNSCRNGKVRFVPDVAFVLDARKPEHLGIEPSTDLRAQHSIVIGLNVSGLLFNGGYTRDNMFGLRSNYRELIHAVIKMVLEDERAAVLLVPHVFPPEGLECESDLYASRQVLQELGEKYTGRVFHVRGEYDQSEIKYIIGLCDFFIGSRMHSCIAAMSQCIPAVGIAYSKKFSGVFESIGLKNCVVDARNCGEKQVLEKVEFVFEHRNEIREHLKQTMPQVKKNIAGIFMT